MWNNYRLRSRGDNTFGSVCPSVCLSICGRTHLNTFGGVCLSVRLSVLSVHWGRRTFGPGTAHYRTREVRQHSGVFIQFNVAHFQAASPEDAEAGMVFMQEMIDLSKQQAAEGKVRTYYQFHIQ